MKLNPAQHEAVNTLSGPLLVLAGAGTGKTRVVTCRIAALIQHGTPPERILAVTFTRKAAAEMQQRAGALLGRRQETRPEISTFHSLCRRILRRHATRLGYPESFSIYDRADQESLARAALREIQAPASLRPRDLLTIISGWKMRSLSPAQASSSAGTDHEHMAASAYRRYQQALEACGAIDFDDLLFCTEQLFKRHEDVRLEEAARFCHLLIDEYQDTNGPQYRIVEALARDHGNLCVVGDDDQSIYAWRGADSGHILRFQRDWPGARVVRLEENYRSTAQILHMANRLIAFNKQRHGKVLRSPRNGPKPRILQLNDEELEAQTVVAEIRAQVAARKASPRDYAILFRTNELTRLFEQELRRVGLPYVVLGGTSFFDRKEVRDLLAYLKLLVQPRDDVSLRRIINVPPRGISAAAAGRLQKQASGAKQSLWAALADPAGESAKTARAVAGFRSLVQRQRQAFRGGSLTRAFRGLIDDLGYEAEIDRLYANPDERAARLANVEGIFNAMREYERTTAKPTLLGFLDDVSLDPQEGPDTQQQIDRDAVVLLTLHSAKGLEFPRVYLVGMEEGILPHRRSVQFEAESVDEERRLCYVGVTRAQDELTLTLPLNRLKWGKQRPTIPSRFLFELVGKADSPAAVAARAGRHLKRAPVEAPHNSPARRAGKRRR